jgi:hypothetical protein
VLRSISRAVATLTVAGLVALPVPVASARSVSVTTVAQRSADPLDGLTPRPEWGSVTGHRAVLRRGCHTYTYSYSLTPPEGIWALEVFISGPGPVHLAAGAYLDGYDPPNGTGHYTLCRATTRPGRFTIEGKLSVDDGAGHISEGRLPPDHYRLRRLRR